MRAYFARGSGQGARLVVWLILCLVASVLCLFVGYGGVVFGGLLVL